MRRKKGLQTIQTLAESDETVRSRIVSDQRWVLHEQERRLEQLEQYCREYQGMNSPSDQGIGIHLIRGRRGFVQKLNEAIDNQRQIVARAAEQLDAQLAHWRNARAKAQSLQKFADRMTAQEDRRTARKEQTELDDIGRDMASKTGS